MEFIARPTPGGGLNLGARNTAIFDDFVKNNPTVPWKLSPVLPESNKQRRYLEGAVIPLVAFYAENYDHRNTDDLRVVREWLKMEFNSASVVVNGHVHQVAKSTKGRDALQPFLERVVGWLQDNYEPPHEAVDPAEFMHWRDTVFAYGGADNYIDYLKSTNIL